MQFDGVIMQHTAPTGASGLDSTKSAGTDCSIRSYNARSQPPNKTNNHAKAGMYHHARMVMSPTAFLLPVVLLQYTRV